MFDLNLKWKPSRSKENMDMVKALSKLGWSTVAWNTNTFGKLTASVKPPSPVSLEPLDAKECLKYRSLVCGLSTTADIVQLNRLTVTLDEVVDAQALTAGNEMLKAFDIIAASPGNAAVFAHLCKSAQVDIITLDFSRRLPFPIIKKQLDQAIERGIYFEIVYAPLLQGPHARKEILAGTRILIQFLRGKNLIISSGAENHTDVRGTHDVLNIGQLLNLTQEQAKLAITKNCESLIKHAKARRLKFIPVEVLPAEEVYKRLPKRSQQVALAKGTNKRSVSDTFPTSSGAVVLEDGPSKRVKIDAAAEGAATPTSDIEQSATAEKEALASDEEDSHGGSGSEMSEDDGNLKF